ncbi:TIGR03564 family F420-dependent LLM class oxidoreductase [Mycolicibacterium goodii]|uniref:TIGR03564 family F420-dependent LLM class oxidoreductase n=1 Tax=Mycolicibacterium goodii TaxID=134601 RepID=A0ABS6HZW6_MYCGD|nr:TIGR03564 family F420-dependent LLM class oxidoreductase [Mycolicibacterium goodii]MBU8827485.1 TIGR03564 family F420-dependent LLM class oxidoreductase [Mycolicibacterium goodii]MBU8840848.1 TIGR03564 family F420-dependent LLM class oxidoreductase [Mycolicibacterium goodii]
MQISRFVFPTGGFDEFVDDIAACERDGFGGAWVPHIFEWDALTALAVAAGQTTSLRLGTAVVPVYPTHPVALAQTAMTTQAASGGRFTLGLGTSHRFVVENVWGMRFDRPRQHMAEFLRILTPAMDGEQVEVRGEHLSAATVRPLRLPGTPPPDVVLAAMGPAMLRLAGTHADGTVTWMTGVRTVAGHVVPTLTAAAEHAQRRAPRVIVGLPVCVTDDAAAAREVAREQFAVYNDVPSYRAMLDREGLAYAGDAALVGSADEVAERIGDLASAGATELCANVFGTPDEQAATVELLGRLG